MIKNTVTRALATLLLLCASSALWAQIITLTGADFKPLIGKQTGLYSFFAVKEGRLVPVPHQWVQWSKEGYPYFEQDDSTHLIVDPPRIDAEDRLLLRFADGVPAVTGNVSEHVAAALLVSHNHQ